MEHNVFKSSVSHARRSLGAQSIGIKKMLLSLSTHFEQLLCSRLAELLAHILDAGSQIFPRILERLAETRVAVRQQYLSSPRQSFRQGQKKLCLGGVAPSTPSVAGKDSLGVGCSRRQADVRNVAEGCQAQSKAGGAGPGVVRRSQRRSHRGEAYRGNHLSRRRLPSERRSYVSRTDRAPQR